MATVGMVREALLRAGERSATRGAGGFDIQGLRHGVVAVRWRPPHGEPASDGGLALLEDYARLLRDAGICALVTTAGEQPRVLCSPGPVPDRRPSAPARRAG